MKLLTFLDALLTDMLQVHLEIIGMLLDKLLSNNLLDYNVTQYVFSVVIDQMPEWKADTSIKMTRPQNQLSHWKQPNLFSTAHDLNIFPLDGL